MKQLATVEMAGIRLCLMGDETIEVLETEAAMQPFFRSDPAPPPTGADVVRITVSRDPMPLRSAGLVKLFDSEQAWSMWASAVRTVLMLQPPGAPSPLWWLDAVSDFSSGFLHCHDDFWQGTDLAPVLRNPVRYPLDQILVMLRLARQKGVILHAAGVAVDGRGYVFPGKSGAGKSTLSTLLAADPRIRLLSDDRMILRRKNGRWLAYGTPWPGDAGIAANVCVPLAGVFFLNKAETTDMADLTPGEALVKLLPVISIPLFDRALGDAVLSSCDALTAEVPMRDFLFTPRLDTLAHLMRLIGV